MSRSVVIVIAAAFLCGCSRWGLPEPGSQKYSEMCSAFFLGLAGLQSGEDVRAKEYLTRSTELVPGEPAAWADLGILQVRQQQFDAAFTSVSKAEELAPENSQLAALLGLIESRRGQLPSAIAQLKKAAELDPHNVRALYSLAEETERQPGAENASAAQTLLGQILKQAPQNTAVWLDNLRLAAKRGDRAEVQRSLAAIHPLAASWPSAAQQQYAALEQSASSGNVRPAAVQAQFLRNVLLRVPEYRANLDEIKTSANLVAPPFVNFLRLTPPRAEVGAPDTTTHFAKENATPFKATKKAIWAGAVAITEGAPTLAWADTQTLQLASGAELPLPSRAAGPGGISVAAADLNYDFKPDIVIASANGLKVYQQQDPAHFKDITASSKIEPRLSGESLSGVWPFDFDEDGDLDLVLGKTNGAPVVLRNNGDGSFTTVSPFNGVDGVNALVTADLDEDGNPDVEVVDRAGKLHFFLNQRGGQFTERALPEAVSEGIAAIAAGDLNGDGAIDLVALKANGEVDTISASHQNAAGQIQWSWNKVGRVPAATDASLLVADLDNNGALDVVANRTVLLNDGRILTALLKPLTAAARAVVDLNADGKLDLLALDSENAPVGLLNQGDKSYRWQVIRTKAAQAAGDQRINSFGIGGEIEIRSALLTQKQLITEPFVHFGLGEHTEVPFARIVWPNGVVQAEFGLKADETILATQRIKGSCPMLYAWDGHEMRFVKDVGPWGSGLSVDVNEDGKGIYGPAEWFKVPGDRLAARNGAYEIRLTDEYWETYFLDRYALLAVDHPVNTEVWTDERYVTPSPKPGLMLTTEPQPFAKATDDHGQDVTATVRDLDNRFLGGFAKGRYQALAQDHFVELLLPEQAPKSGSLYLLADGWAEETEESLMKAEAQNKSAREEELSIEVEDQSGCWKPIESKLGYPKGRFKTIVLDIRKVPVIRGQRRLRLRTNLEVYWDRLAWATAPAASEHAAVRSLALRTADLSYRGFSLIDKRDALSPEVPQYGVIANAGIRWRDQEGYVTRYGDVRELLQSVDDRYVITSPGDEVRMTFDAPAAPKPGWKRDFILICDGWVKDGDHNSNFAETVLPLPYHAMTRYDQAPTTLESERAYREHPDDWRNYHTRYVGGRDFVSALWGSN